MKNNEKLLDAIGEANEIHVPDMRDGGSKKQKKHISMTSKIAIVSGACAAVLVVAAAVINNNTPQTDEKLLRLWEEHRIYPKISDIKAETSELEPIVSDIISGNMGFEGYMVHDISELDTINPWSADKPLDSLPVYKNLSVKEKCNVPVHLTQEQMEEIANNAAYCLGVKVISTSAEPVSDILSNPPEEAADLPYCVEIICDGEIFGIKNIKIRVLGDGQMSIDFDSGMRLPDGYSFTYANTSEEQAIDVMEYLTDEFKALLQFEDPAVYSFADRNIYGEQIRGYYVYDKHEDYKQDILCYNFTNTEFCCDDNGNLMVIRIKNPMSAAQNLGEYPIIDANEAEQLLLTGNFITSVPTEYLKNGAMSPDIISKTELIYRTEPHDKYYQPYYRFYVELSDEYYAEGSRSQEMKEYGAFYVPAIESEYLQMMG